MAISKISGLGERLWLGNAAATGGVAFDISGDVGAIDTAEISMADIDATGIDKSYHERLVGLIDAKFGYTGFFNAGPGRNFTLLQSLVGGDAAAIWALGAAEGSLCYAIQGILTSFPVTRAANGSDTIKPTVEVDQGFAGFGVLGMNATPDTTPSSHTAINDGRASALGVTLFAELIALTGTDVTLTLFDSADGITFAAVSPAVAVTFTGTTAGYAVAASTLTAAVRQYVELRTTGTFTSATVIAGILRG